MKIKRLTEFRCPHCSKLLARYSGEVEIKCPRCKKVFNSNAGERLTPGDVRHAQKISE